MFCGSNTCIIELILVLQILYLCYRTYSCISDLIRSLLWYKSTLRYYTDSLYGGTRSTTGLISLEGHIFVLISDSYTYTRILIHVLVLITDIYLSNLL